MNSSKILNSVLRKELSPILKESKLLREDFEIRLARAQKNLNEAKTEALLRKTRLSEYYVSSRIKDPNFRPAKPWTDVKAENALKQMGAKPYKQGLNPHSYELDTPNDRLWFYSDGEVWSTTQTRSLGYEIAPGGSEIEIWNAPGSKSTKSGFQVGVIKNVNGKPTFVSSKENLERSGKATEDETEESSSWLDTFQLILDYAGWIPIIGDAIDVINAIIFFFRGKIFDGFLSLIAVIPLVGTGAKFGIKAIYKGLKLDKLINIIKRSLKSKNTDDLWRELMTSGALSPSTLKEIGHGFEAFADVLKRSYSGIKKIPAIDSKNIIKQLDDAADWMKRSGKSIDDLLGASKKLGSKQLYKSAQSISSNVGFLRKFGRAMTLNILPRLKKAAFWDESKIKKIALGLEARFSREFAADPTKLTKLVFSTPNASKLYSQLQSNLLARTKSLPATARKEFLDRLNSKGLMKGNRVTINSAEDLQKFLQTTELWSSTRGIYDSTAQQIIKFAKENDSIVWNVYKTGELNNLKTMLSKDMIPGGSNLFKELDFSFRKNVDIIWNEMEDVAESFGIKDKDEVNGVIWPLITVATAEFLPGVYDAGKTIQGWIKSIKGSPEGSAMLNSAKDALGISSEEELAYDPESEKGGEFK